jgi:SAM-dependent methyltransferase
VAPAEVESVLREHPAVRDVHVRAGRGRVAGADVLIADVELAPAQAPPDEAALRDFARQRLSGYKVPEQIHIHHALPKNSVGKVTALTPRYRLRGAEAVAAMRAYRRSELLFALADLGLIDRLSAGADAEELAGQAGAAAGPLRWLLDTAVSLGLLATDRQDGARDPAAAGLPDLLALEAELSGTWLTRGALAAVVRSGFGARPFDHADLGDRLPSRYRAAMHGPHTAARTRLGLRLAGQAATARVLEVSAGPGRYLAAALAAHPGSFTGHLVQTGRLAGPPLAGPLPGLTSAVAEGRVTIGPRPPARAFDLCVVANAVHGPGPGADLNWLLDRLAPGGLLLIDDIFLPDDPAGGPGAELGLDWLTHGGLACPRLPDLRAAITAAGGVTTRVVRLTPPECCLVLVREENLWITGLTWSGDTASMGGSRWSPGRQETSAAPAPATLPGLGHG